MQIVLGTTLGAQQRGGAAPIITATVAPAAYSYSDGDRIDDLPDYATLDSTGNYDSTAGDIASVEWLVDGTDRAGDYVLSAGEAVVLRVTDNVGNVRPWTIDASVAAVVPNAFAVGQWSLANDGTDVTLTISALPDDGGSALTDLEYSVNAGSAVSLGAATTGDYVITADVADDIEIRAVNAVGDGAWSDTKAVPAAGAFPAATGGTVTDITDPDDGLPYRVHTFTGNGTFEVTTGGDFEYLILGAGASGGAYADGRTGQGGGAGGDVDQGTITLATGTNAIVIGTGGAAAVSPDSGTPADGNDGGNTTALGITANGGLGGAAGISTGLGGAGGDNSDFTGGAGASGQAAGGGGAGAGENGNDAVPNIGGDGGDGVTSSISGTSTSYGGGGGGSARTSNSAEGGLGGGTAGNSTGDSLAAAANTGAGTGGASGGGVASCQSGEGGSGLVIIRYRRAA